MTTDLASSHSGTSGPAETILITGAAGIVGSVLRPRLARPGRLLRLVDITDLDYTLGHGEEFVRASVTDDAAMESAMEGVDTVVHLGGLSGESSWDQVIDVNIRGTNTVFEAARRAGAGRLVYASSNHAVGYHQQQVGTEVPDGLVPRPDSFYGVSKAFGEALGSLYHDRYGMNVICLRIGSCFPRPSNARMLETWLSADDAGRLFEAALAAEGHHVVWGVSANTHRQWSLKAARALGYEPRDDASSLAAGPLSKASHPASRFVGGDDMPQVPD